jgi:hypothetical protein
MVTESRETKMGVNNQLKRKLLHNNMEIATQTERRWEFHTELWLIRR